MSTVFVKERNIWVEKKKKISKLLAHRVAAIQRAMLHLKFQWGRYFATSVSFGARLQLMQGLQGWSVVCARIAFHENLFYLKIIYLIWFSRSYRVRYFEDSNRSTRYESLLSRKERAIIRGKVKRWKVTCKIKRLENVFCEFSVSVAREIASRVILFRIGQGSPL